VTRWIIGLRQVLILVLIMIVVLVTVRILFLLADLVPIQSIIGLLMSLMVLIGQIRPIVLPQLEKDQLYQMSHLLTELSVLI